MARYPSRSGPRARAHSAIASSNARARDPAATPRAARDAIASSSAGAARDPALSARAARAHAAALLGRAAEAAAARFLESQGLEILLCNFRRRLGEIDLVARDGDALVIVEVRTRGSQRYGGAAASIDWRKRTRIARAAQLLLRAHREYSQSRMRFDVIVIFNALTENPRVQWLKHAFDCST